MYGFAVYFFSSPAVSRWQRPRLRPAAAPGEASSHCLPVRPHFSPFSFSPSRGADASSFSRAASPALHTSRLLLLPGRGACVCGVGAVRAHGTPRLRPRGAAASAFRQVHAAARGGGPARLSGVVGQGRDLASAESLCVRDRAVLGSERALQPALLSVLHPHPCPFPQTIRGLLFSFSFFFFFSPLLSSPPSCSELKISFVN